MNRVSEKVSPAGEGIYEVEGKLNLYGVNKNIKIVLKGLQ